jgi:hypothetical protein
MMREWSATWCNDLCHVGRFLGTTRASGIAARGAAMKFHQWPAAAADQVWQ